MVWEKTGDEVETDDVFQAYEIFVHPSLYIYLIPHELPGELPVEHIFPLRAETSVDQSVLRGKRWKERQKRMSHRDGGNRDKLQACRRAKQTGKHGMEET